MKTVPQNWVQWDQNEVLPFTGGISFTMRTAKECIVRDIHGLILGMGKGEQEIHVTGDGECIFECETDIWVMPSTRVQERLQRSTEIFTSLDRPAPMSPEMLAIERMMRKNEIERERDRQEMEKRFADRQRTDVRSEPEDDVDKTPASKKKAVRKNTERSSDNSEVKVVVIESEDASTAGIHGKPDDPDGSGTEDSS